jgi:DMSO/TMAO reductase YedYZ molybdopterin-dependent catalytic subunit
VQKIRTLISGPLREAVQHLGCAVVEALPALCAGLVAALATSALMLFLRLVAGIVTLPELVGELILPHLSAGAFVHLLIQFGKTRPLAYALLGQIVLGVALAPLQPLIAQRIGAQGGGRMGARWPGRHEWLSGGVIALGMWLLALGLFWPVLPENLHGFPIASARAITALGLAAMFALYAATLTLLLHAIVSLPACPGAPQGELANADRRTFLARSGVAAVGGLLLGGFALDALIQALYGRSNLSYEGMTTQPPITYLTPTDKFYVVSKNVLDPDVALGDWALDVGGLVARPGRYDLASLQALPQESRVITLECIANGVDGRLLSTAMWRGVTLKFLLAAHGGIQPGASQVVFTSADGYQSSLLLSELLAVDTLLAWEMNGAQLPSRHGYPLRVVVPGHFGEQSPKWLTSIELADHTFKGFYQQQGWYAGPVYTISRIDHPGKGDQRARGRRVHVDGVAYGGARGIQSVEVSTDGGATWQRADVQAALSQQSWALWSWEWTPTAPGAYTLVVRATDGTGAPQITHKQGTVPNGGTGLHSVPVRVS